MEVKLNGNSFFRVTADYGATDDWHHTAHTGVDLAMNLGTRIFSPTDGVIEQVVNYGTTNIGKGIIIKTGEGEHLILGHLSDNSHVFVGEHVHTGDYLALSGSSGNSSGPHLHVGLRDAHNHFSNPGKFFNGDHIQLAQLPDKVMSAGDTFHNAISEFADTLSNLGLNLIHNIHWEGLIDTLDFIFSIFIL